MGGIGEHHRDIKSHRKRQRDTSVPKSNKKGREHAPPARRCWDWMIISGNCHYAKNRSAFKEYRRVGRKVPHGMFEAMSIFVAGVGTVELKVRSTPEADSPTRTLVLEDVLHIPEANCNGFSVPVYHTIHGGMSRPAEPSGTDERLQPLWYGEAFKGLSKLALAGNPQGESYLGDGLKMLSIHVGSEDFEKIIGPRKEKVTESSEEEQPWNSLPESPCQDWIVVSGNRHFARDRETFKTYRKIDTVLQNYATDNNVYIAGMGTVELKVQALPEPGSPIRTLLLENVLHIPDAICNGFSFIKYHKSHGTRNQYNRREGQDEDGTPLWCSEKFHEVALRLVRPDNHSNNSYLLRDLLSLDIFIEDEELPYYSDYSGDSEDGGFENILKPILERAMRLA